MLFTPVIALAGLAAAAPYNFTLSSDNSPAPAAGLKFRRSSPSNHTVLARDFNSTAPPAPPAGFPAGPPAGLSAGAPGGPDFQTPPPFNGTVPAGLKFRRSPSSNGTILARDFNSTAPPAPPAGFPAGPPAPPVVPRTTITNSTVPPLAPPVGPPGGLKFRRSFTNSTETMEVDITGLSVDEKLAGQTSNVESIASVYFLLNSNTTCEAENPGTSGTVFACGNTPYSFGLVNGTATQYALRLYHTPNEYTRHSGSADIETYCHAGGDSSLGSYEICDQIVPTVTVTLM